MVEKRPGYIASVAGFERIPSRAVEHIIFNESLLNGSEDPRVRRFLDPDFLLSKVGFFAVNRPLVISDKPAQSLKLQPPQSHRAFVAMIAGQGLSDEYGNLYGQINVKGIGKSERSSFEEGLDPVGLFGERHAVQDMHVSDVLASHGARTARGLAVITLNHNYLRNLMTFGGYRLDRQIEKVEANNDYASLYVRLIGADRHSGFVWEGAKGPFAFSAKVDRAAKLLFQEENSRGLDNYLDRYLMRRVFVTQLNRVFGLPSSSVQDKLDILMKQIAHFFNYNMGIFEVVSKKHFKGELSANIHSLNQDLAGMWIDWENALPESGQTMEAFTPIYTHYPKHLTQDAYAGGLLRAEDFCKRLDCKLSQ